MARFKTAARVWEAAATLAQLHDDCGLHLVTSAVAPPLSLFVM